MKTKLILIEGLPGSGKSTTAQLINSALQELNKKTEFFYEGNINHPADFDGVAYFTDSEFSKLLQDNGEYKELINKIAIRKHGDYFIFYKMAMEKLGQTLPEELFFKIIRNDVYELPLMIHMKLILDRWRQFADSAIKEDKIYIFECCFIQNPVTVSMIRDNAPKEAAINFVKELAHIIKDLDPVLIYLTQKDIAVSFSKIVKERPEEWYKGFMYYYTQQGFGKANNLIGLDGTIQVLEHRKTLELEIFNSLEIDKFIFDNSEYNSVNVNKILMGKFI